ncbi:MAG: MaoC family dehydratase [Solirubrobacteraceae bacterium]|jgi:acyl dehydratase
MQAHAVTSVRSIDELKAKAGSHLGYSQWHEVTQHEVDSFAEATEDYQWIHTDVERAKTGPFGQTIAQGYLTLSLAVPLLFEVLALEGTSFVVNYGVNRVRFPTPVPVGGRIRLGAVLKEVRAVTGGVQALVEATFELEGSRKPPCVAEILFRFYLQDGGAS